MAHQMSSLMNMPANSNHGVPGIDPPKSLPSLLSLKVSPPSELQSQTSSDDIGRDGDSDSMKLPAALEQALAFKTDRAKEVGADPNDIVSLGKSPNHENVGEDVSQLE